VDECHREAETTSTFAILKWKARGGVLILTRPLAVVWVDDENTDGEELHAPPRHFPQQREAGGASAEHGVDRQGDGSPHYEHKPGEVEGKWRE